MSVLESDISVLKAIFICGLDWVELEWMGVEGIWLGKHAPSMRCRQRMRRGKCGLD
jgi:hypothetical protein